MNLILPQSRQGFVLIIVLGLLGVMAFLALEMVEQSRQARTLSLASMLDTHTHLLARSGIEKGKQEIFAPYLASPPLPLSAPHPYQNADLVVTLPIDATGDARVRIGDSNGKICLNDGLAAGRAELGGAYNASALNPWPTSGGQDVSAWINLRLRRLLNAYGDVHKFASDMLQYSPATRGWPSWQKTAAEPTINHAFIHTATDGADRFVSLPPRLPDGTATTDPRESAGLGDRIIGLRPAKGYTHMDQVKDTLNAWGAQFLTVSYLDGQSFGDLALPDLALKAWHDTAFWRMRREFGGNHSNFPDQAALQAPQSPQSNPPDFRNLWKPHPLPPINLNAASDAVRAAVFQAPTDISLSESLTSGVAMAWVQYNINDACCRDAKLQTRVVNGQNRENGPALSGPLGPWQLRRFLSVRDAMVASRAYAGIASTAGWPDSFERFTWHLRRMMVMAKLVERVDNTAGFFGSPPGSPFPPNPVLPDNWTLSEWYPHLLSLQRRLPVWMGAPLALLSPYRDSQFSQEDFTFRSHLPKVMFLPAGLFSLTSTATLARSPLTSRRRILTQVMAFETKTLRDQASFVAHRDPLTSSEIMIGPELAPVVSAGGASRELGVVGLHDRGTSLRPMGKPFARYDFDQGLTQTAGTFSHQDPDTDFHTSPAADNPHQELRGSAPVNNDVSIFPRGSGFQPSSFSPFGGLYLSHLRHGAWASPERFSHSFYFRPENFLLSDDGGGKIVGRLGNKGVISLWLRVPPPVISFGNTFPGMGTHYWYNAGTGSNRYYHRGVTVFDLNLWEKLELRSNPSPGTLETILRPVNLNLSMIQDYISGTSQNNTFPGTWGFRLTMSTGAAGGNTPRAGYPNYRREALYDGILKPITLPWADPAPDFTVPPFSDLLSSYYDTSGSVDWRQRFTRNNSPSNTSFIREIGNSHTVYTPESGALKTPYLFRTGSWARVACLWDTNLTSSVHQQCLVIPHTINNLVSMKSNTNVNYHDQFRSTGLFNPKMGLSFGERFYEVMATPATQGTGPSPAPTIGDLIPEGRLNSQIDNLYMMFGATPPTLPAVSSTFTDLTSHWNAIQALPMFNNRRYNILAANEPSWVIDPHLPAGSKILQFGARIYDVPFTPEYGNGTDHWSTWPVKAPRVDPDLLDLSLPMFQDNPVAPVQRAASCGEWSIILKSRDWASYDLVPVTPTTRFRLRYRNCDTVLAPGALTSNNDPANPDGRPLDAVISDIPYITEINWRWIPAGGMKILSWEQE